MGCKIIMPANAMMMIHNPLAGAIGKPPISETWRTLDKAKEIDLETAMPRVKVSRDENERDAG